jgi:hypothetical protein
MAYTLQAPVLLDKRCILGQGVRLVPAGRIAGKWNPNTFGGPGLGGRNGTITCKLWLNTEPFQRDAHGGWSHGEVSLEKEKRKGTYIILNLTSLSLLLQINYCVKYNLSR